MANIPDNIVAILGVDNAGAITNIDPNLVFNKKVTTTTVTVPTATTATVKPNAVQNTVTNVIETTVALEINASSGNIPIVNSNQDNLEDSIVWQTSGKIGFNTKNPRWLIDANGSSINITPALLTDGYKINNINFAYADFSVIGSEQIVLGDDLLLPIVNINNIILRGLIPVTPTTKDRILFINDLGEVSAKTDIFLESLNGLTNKVQVFAFGSSGTTPNVVSTVVSTVGTHTFNFPMASATGVTAGLISKSEYDIFNSKIGGSGTINYLPKFTGTSALGNSLIYDDGARVGINTTTPLYGELNINSPSLGTNAVLAFSVQDGTYNPRVIVNHVTSTSSHYLEFNSGFSTQTGFANYVFSNGNVGIGTTSPSFKLDVIGTARFSSNVAIGSNTSSIINLIVNKTITGGASSFGIYQSGSVQSDVTTAIGFYNTINTQATTFTINAYRHFQADNGTIGAGSTVGLQIGFFAQDLSQASLNYGFYGNLSSASNKWNLYMAGTANNYLAGNLGIGAIVLTSTTLSISKGVTGGTIASAVVADGSILSDVTSLGIGFGTFLNTQQTTFTLTSYRHFHANQGAIRTGSTVSEQIGFYANSGLIGAGSNYGFFGNIPSGTNRWNLYMGGTANNYLAGSLGIGTTSVSNVTLVASKDITGSTTSIGIQQNGFVQSGVTAAAYGYFNALRTATATFTIPVYSHYYAVQSTIGVGTTITNQIGYYAESNLTGATNNFGFVGSIPSGANRWNLYMNGTAANYLAGNLSVGTTTTTYKFNWASGSNFGFLDLAVGGAVAGSTGFFDIYTGASPATRFRIDATGNVGIGRGTQTITENLSVGNSNGATISISSNRAAGTTAVPKNLDLNFRGYLDDIKARIRSWDDSGSIGWGNLTFSLFTTGFVVVEAMRITHQGNVLIGTTTNAGFKLDVTGTARVTGNLTAASFIRSGGTSVQYLMADGSVSTLTDVLVTSRLLTGYTTLTGTVSATDTILQAFGRVQAQLNALSGSLIYKGSWDASTNSPTIVSSVGTNGNYYIVSVAGTTNINGISSWAVGDWIVFNSTTGTWQKIANQSVISVNGLTGAVTITTTNIAEGTNLYYTNARGIGSTLTGYVTGAGTISSSDTILSAIQKLNGNIAALGTGVSSVNLLTGAVTLTTEQIPEGTNLYYTNARGIGSTLTGYVSGAGTISSTDTILSAIQKLNGNISFLVTGVSSVFGRTGVIVAASGDYTTTLVTEGTNLYYTNNRGIGSTLTGYVSSSGTISSTDTILSAIQKLNGNVSALVTGVSSVNSLTGDVTLTTENISEITNLYYTNARGIGSVLTGYTSVAGIISSADTILSAIQKLNGNISTLVTGVSSVFGRTGAIVAVSGDYTTTLVTEGTRLYYTNARGIASTLTGYVSGSGTISSSDTILSAIQKLNGNVSSLTTGVSSVFGRTGAVIAVSGDYTTTLVTEGTNLYFTTARARVSVSAGTGLTYNSTTGVFSSTITQYTDALARTAISLTTTGTSGAATYNSTTGVLNIPQYQVGVSSFNTRTGAITLSSADVTTALGFTPYNSTNPSGYITRTSLDANTPLSYNNLTGVFTISQANATTNGYLSSSDWSSFNNKVPSTRTLTINGIAFDLSADRSWNISTGGITGSGTLNRVPLWSSSSNLIDSNIYADSGSILFKNPNGGTRTLAFHPFGTISVNSGYSIQSSEPIFYLTPLHVFQAGALSSELTISNLANDAGTVIKSLNCEGNGTTFFTPLQFQAASFSFNAEITATSFKKSGGLSTQYLMADGSVTTGGASGITGSGTFRYVPLWGSSSSLGDSMIFYNPLFNSMAIKLPTANNQLEFLPYGNSMTNDTGNTIFSTSFTPATGTTGAIRGYVPLVLIAKRLEFYSTDVTQGQSGSSVTNRFIVVTDDRQGFPSFGTTISSGTADSFTAPMSFKASSFTFENPVKATSFIKEGGLSTQYLMADGSVTTGGSGSGNVSGTGTINYITKWSATNTISNSLLFDNGTNIGIGTTSPIAKLDLAFTPSVGTGMLRIAGTTTVNDSFTLSNATSNSNVFIPIFQYKATTYGYGGGANLYPSGTYGGGFIANVDDVSYPDGIGAGAAMHFNARNYANTGALSNRNLFSFGNWLTNYLVIKANGNIGIGTNDATEKLEVIGTVKANSFVKSGGLSTQYLMADGSVTTGGSSGVTGSGAINYIARWNSATNIGTGAIYDTGSAVGVGTLPSVAYVFNVQGVSGKYISFWTPTIGGNNENGIISHDGNGLSGLTPLQITTSALYLPATFINTTSVSGGGALQVGGDVNISGTFRVNGTAIGTGGGGVSGSGTLNRMTVWTGSTSIGDSSLYTSSNGNLYINTSSGTALTIDSFSPNTTQRTNLGTIEGLSTWATTRFVDNNTDYRGIGQGFMVQSGNARGVIYGTVPNNSTQSFIHFLVSNGAGLSNWINKMTIKPTTVNISSLPTSTSGLVTGDLYRDSNGFVKVVL
jgi:hypothetical protein